MDAFRLLTQGARFKNSKGDKTQQLFKQQPVASTSTAHLDEEADGEDARPTEALPSGLDFFNVGASSSEGKKKRKREEPEFKVAMRSVPTATNRTALTGRSPPTPFESLKEFITSYSPSAHLIKNLSLMGVGDLSEVGKAAGAVFMANRDLMTVAPTGSGKTIAYLLPLLTLLKVPAKSLKEEAGEKAGGEKKGPRAIILSPTRELAMQIQNEAAKLTQGRKWRVVVLSKATEGSVVDGVDILIATPNRLCNALTSTDLSLANTQYIIVDEADRLLDDTFLPQVDEILTACTNPNLRKALFTATLPSSLEEIGKGILKDGVRVVVGIKDAATALINQKLEFAGTETGKLLALRNLIKSGLMKPPCLIFVQSITRANDLFQELIYDGINVDVIHSERTADQRDKVVQGFREGKVWVLITTELMARGMDFRGVNLVVNYDFPQTVQSYVHRIGRTGRAGREGEAITYFTTDDAPYLKIVANVMKSSGCEVPDWILSLKKPSKKQRRNVAKSAVDRKDVRTVGGTGLGRQASTKKREMVEASKRRKQKMLEVAQEDSGKSSNGAEE